MKTEDQIETIKEILQRNESSQSNDVLWYARDAFIKTQAKWYAKLKQKNFHDIEYKRKKGFIGTISPTQIPCEVTKYRSKQHLNLEYYYDLCLDYLHRTTFDSKLEYLVWEQHCNGLSYRQIERELKRLRKKPRSIHTVHRIVNKHLSLMKSQALQRSSEV